MCVHIQNIQMCAHIFVNYVNRYMCSHMLYLYHQARKGGMQMDRKIGKLIKVVRALTQLALEIGTLIAVIKMIIESLQ